FWETSPLLGGTVGFEINLFLQDYLGYIGTILLLTFLFIVYLVVRLNVMPSNLITFFKNKKKEIQDDFATVSEEITETVLNEEDEEITVSFTEDEVILPTASPLSENENDVTLEVEETEDEEELEALSNKLVKDFGEFDPKLE